MRCKLWDPRRDPAAARRRPVHRAGLLAAGGLLIAACTAGGAGGSGAARGSGAAPSGLAAPQVRVNQVGYVPGGPKMAFAMLPRREGSISFTVSGRGRVVFRGRAGRDLGGWNSRYRAVYALDFTALTRPGSYQITVSAGGGPAVSPPFAIAAPGRLYGQLVLNAVRYFTSERDGADVNGAVLNRRPANLTDQHAWVYQVPRYDSNDNLLGGLHRIGGPVNVAGGWFDAGGGYEKFAYTTSFADGLMLLAARDTGARYPTLAPEAGFGLSWLTRLWNPARKVLYIQAGIGSGNASNTIQGDYNFWFLPQAEDRLDVRRGGHPGPSAYYVRYRPVFAAAPPGRPVSPELAGRLAADFALGAQLAARAAPARAAHLLSLARSVFAMARTSQVGQLVTTYPHDYYAGTEWRSDMAWGAAEMALADEALGGPAGRLRADLAVAARWARAYIAQGHPAGGDTLNLYDNGALGEAELLRAMRGAHAAVPVIAPRVLLADLAAQLRLALRLASGDPFGLGAGLGSADASPHAFGLFVTDALYRRYGGSRAFLGFGQQQLNFDLGANGWGTGFVVGAGSTFPHCMQSEIANLSGSLTGRGDLQLGATVDGPGSPASFSGLGTVSGMRPCRAGDFTLFNTKAAAYADNVVSWPSVEPADDYVAMSLLAFALAAGGG